jgi:hypothetical protein
MPSGWWAALVRCTVAEKKGGIRVVRAVDELNPHLLRRVG